MDGYVPKKINNSSIFSLDNLLAALGLSLDDFKVIQGLETNGRYTAIHLKKKNGDDRVVYDPHPLVRKFQRRIKNRLFSQIQYPHYLYGSISDLKHPRDYISCASRHCKAKTILKIDITSFFDYIDFDMVYKIFRELFSYSDEVSEALAYICTRDGIVPQGAPTSSFIANLCFFDVEGRIVKGLEQQKLRYTRLTDDITVSSTIQDKSLAKAKGTIVSMIETAGFVVNEEKTSIESIATMAFKVHGLRIDKETPQLPRDEIRIIRAAVHNLKSLAREPNARTSFQYRKRYESISGRVNKLARTCHPRYKKHRQELRAILPLPSRRDIKRSQVMLLTLVRDYDFFSDTPLYMKRYHRLRQRLVLIQRIYKREAKEMWKKLKALAPTKTKDEHEL
ncbi:reverse transcriptase family protein [Pseudomonas serboccidentalis]|uniref:reverse transcriptase family protein n=1 Tax=Pseudomonas serboccidentalis TaxID=2964670 RepID=UPI0039E059ED